MTGTFSVQKKTRLDLRPLRFSFKRLGRILFGAAGAVHKRFPAAGLLLASACLVAVVYQFGAYSITIYVDGDPVQTVRTFSRNVDELLQEIQLPLHPRDRINPPAETVLSPQSVITIDKAFPVFVIADNSVAEIWTPVMTVNELLKEEGYSLGPYDRIEPEGLEHVYNLAEIKIVRVEKKYESEKKTVPYADVTRGNLALDRGFSRVVSEGKPGLQEDLVEVTFEDGVEVSRVVVHSSLLEEPVDRIVEVGENTRLERDGRVMEFSRALMVSATAYCPGTPESGCPRNKQGHAFCTGPYNNGYTYTGKKCVQGLGTIDSPRMVAVDPKVIPLRSMLYIEGFGFARAEDIGGAIKGNKIDILFDKHSDVARFGVKYGIKVYLLTQY